MAVLYMHTNLSPSVLVTSIRGFLSNRDKILAAEIFAFVASGAKELARPKESAVKTTAANTLQGSREKDQDILTLSVSHTDSPEEVIK